MKKWMQAAAVLGFIFWIGVPPANAQHEGVGYYFTTTDWVVGSESPAKRSKTPMYQLEFVRKGDDINNWKELFTYQDFKPDKDKRVPADWLEKVKALRETECPGATVWNVIQQDESSILYEWQAAPCAGWPEQHEIARIFYGKYNVFILHYAAKVHELDAAKRKEWIDIMEDAYLFSGSGIADVLLPSTMDRVVAALKLAMQSQGCDVTNAAPDGVECKRPQGKVIAFLKAEGSLTRMDLYGRFNEQDFSVPLCEAIKKNLDSSNRSGMAGLARTKAPISTLRYAFYSCSPTPARPARTLPESIPKRSAAPASQLSSGIACE